MIQDAGFPTATTLGRMSADQLSAHIAALEAAGYRPSQLGTHATITGNVALLEAYEEQESRKGWRQGRFMLGAGDDPEQAESFLGWHNGRHWNGWATPLFTRDVCETIVATLTREYAAMPRTQWDTAEQGTGGYSAEHDSFYFYDAGESGPAVDYMFGWPQTLPNGVVVYPFGTCAWCWEEVTEEE